jgi:hypothetical protein
LIGSPKGSAVVGAVIGLTAVTLVAISVITAMIAGWNVMLIRDAAVSGAREGALADKTPADGERYALKLLDERVPSLANFSTNSNLKGDILQVSISAELPQVGFIDSISVPLVVGSAELERQF